MPPSVPLAPEVRLALLGARTTLPADVLTEMRALITAGVRWERLGAFLDRHHLAPLFNRHVPALAGVMPEEIAGRLQAFGRRLALTNLAQANELVRVAKLFEAAGIAVMPFKGLMLGATVYGDLGLRRFGDLDVLVHRPDLERARDLLAANGYAPYRVMSPRREQAFYRTGMGFEMVRHDGRAIVELHWTFLNRAHAFRLDPEDVWRRSRPVELWGMPLRTFAPEDHLLYLCAHGSKSFWERLVWVTDVAELIRREAVDWAALRARARAIHAERMLHLGLFLAARLFDAPVPADLVAEAEADRDLPVLARWVEAHTLRLDAVPFVDAEKTWFHLQMRERFSDRLPYYGHLLWIMPQPNRRDRAFVQLPSYLTFLYPVVKPIRWVHSRFQRGEAAAAPTEPVS